MVPYVRSLEGLTPSRRRGFFVGWPNPPSPETHLRLLAGTDHVVLAVDEGPGPVVGFVTAVTDGVLAAYIPHLEVLPEFQGRGIGTELMRRMLSELDSLYTIDLLCDAEVQPFSVRLGMRPVPGMAVRHHDRQSGAAGPGRLG